ncbi:dephospho-CoA kinase [Mycolicibacterium monacense]|uniref:Dephospho-CoA kinase n=2 Tax=Mycobacteriaceae TaxID=1762 RepID=A0AAD1ITJ2_MYCMB|nr:dephospho-CoA kinase [Mycolicibacterium monacense]MDA4101948.1 dephospho-CoA kinase [Mycolicibacterium monacense DSM 44395]ORB17195.1 dephospho-CoA kinase [Mycolicibacterium monacense DSM 44395]QHP86697.1 dephospho-CoA kinase [Mycolicibacterium monacense DSM 44395]BBZ60239.1 dephospho-CoA kinase [Mycolicibacterium monacense]
MLRIGLTGGIGAGKSTVSATFADCGGVVVDGDVIAREVVEPGTEGLAALVEAFGDDILLPDGALNRPALAAKAFQDDEQRAKLNGIVHPLVGKRRQEIIDSVAEGTVVVEDIPLLVETGMAPFFPLVVVVWADEETRVTRLIERGLPEHDARARMKAQASDEQRRAIADVLLDNSGTREELVEKARQLWFDRILPLAENIRTGEVVRVAPRLMPHNPAWAADAQRIVNRIKAAAGGKALRVDHVGSTSVDGLDAKDVVDIQVTVASLEDADEIAGGLAAVGYPRIQGVDSDVAHDDSGRWGKRLHGAADPGRPANIHLRVDGWPNQRFALLFLAWLAAHPEVRDEYLQVKRAALSAPDYAEAKEPWFAEVYPKALAWAEARDWRP